MYIFSTAKKTPGINFSCCWFPIGQTSGFTNIDIFLLGKEDARLC